MQVKKLMITMAALLLSFYTIQAQGLKPLRLSCEYKENPLGIDVPRPRLSWTLAGAGRNQRQTAYEIVVSDAEKLINEGKGNTWQSGKIVSAQNLHVTFNGAPLRSFTRYWWRVRVYDAAGKPSAWSAPHWFETAMLPGTEWAGKWIGDGSRQFERQEDFYKDDPMPLFRKNFNAAKKVAAARLYISGMGYYEAYLNGKKISDHMLDPGWTTYSKRVLYAVHDITAMLQPGVNTAGIMAGNGWYNPLPLQLWGSRNWRNFLVTGRPCVKAMIRITYADGTSDMISTDETWQTAPGPVIRNNVYLGERYDARKEVKDRAAANAGGSWKNAVPAAGPQGTPEVQMQPAVRVTKVLQPKNIKEVKPGVYLLDMGQNFAGAVRLRVQGEAGRQVILRYGEDTLKDGQINLMTSVAGQVKNGNGGPGAPHIAWQEDRYTLKGEGKETWWPRFTFHGFRYVEVSGWPGKPAKGDIEGLRMNADLEPGGAFTCSNPMLNRLNEVIQWTFLSNVFSVQSDCPAREKLAYPGDIFCSAGAFMHNYQMPGFYTKTVRDLADAQRPLGGITETAPYVGIQDASPGDASGPMAFQAGYPFLIKRMYEHYGDRRIIEENYPALQRQLKFLQSRATGHLFDKEDLGDHESLDEKGIPLTASVFYFLHAQILSEFAAILGKQGAAAEYGALSANIRRAVVNKFYQPASGIFEKGTQTAQVIALWAGMPDKPEEDKVMDALVKAFEKRDWHLSTGIFGTKMMFDVLRERGQNDMAYRIANQRSFPGWGHMIENGATTLWETWKYSDNTYSQNHPMFGSIGEWFYRSLLGINAAAPGFSRIVIRPQPAGDLTYARGYVLSVQGKISSGWEIKNGRFRLKTEIPANTTAEIWVPLQYGATVKEGGKPAAEAAGVQLLRQERGHAVFAVGSGSYAFETSGK